MSIVWRAKAEQDFEQHIDFIALRNPVAAVAMARRLKASVEHLLMFPEAGRPTNIKNVREVVIVDFPLVLRYRRKDGHIQIMRAFHTAQALGREWVSGGAKAPQKEDRIG